MLARDPSLVRKHTKEKTMVNYVQVVVEVSLENRSSDFIKLTHWFGRMSTMTRKLEKCDFLPHVRA